MGENVDKFPLTTDTSYRHKTYRRHHVGKSRCVGIHLTSKDVADVSPGASVTRSARNAKHVRTFATSTKQPVRVAVTGASGQIGYSLLFRIARY